MRFSLLNLGEFQAESGIVQHRQMRHERKRLKNHAHIVQAEFNQLILAHLNDIFPIHDHFAGGGLDEPIEHTDNGGFTGTGQSHDDEDFAGFDGKAGIVDPYGHAGFFVNGLFAMPFLEELQSIFRLGTEYFVQIFHNDLIHGYLPLLLGII